MSAESEIVNLQYEVQRLKAVQSARLKDIERKLERIATALEQITNPEKGV